MTSHVIKHILTATPEHPSIPEKQAKCHSFANMSTAPNSCCLPIVILLPFVLTASMHVEPGDGVELMTRPQDSGCLSWTKLLL